MKRFSLFLLLIIFLTACASPASDELQIVDVYATAAAQPWLNELYACADSASVVLNVSPDSPEILLRVGEPRGLSTPAFQIETEEILVVVHRQSPVQNLSIEQARALFARQMDSSLQIWVYARGEDVQEAFEQTVMNGQDILSSAQIAVSPQEMSDLLNAEVNAVGVLPRHWKAGDTREVFSAGMFPVLAITSSTPEGIVQELIACLQK